MERFFTGFRVLEPGVVPVDDWRPADADGDTAGTQVGLCGVGVVDA